MSGANNSNQPVVFFPANQLQQQHQNPLAAAYALAMATQGTAALAGGNATITPASMAASLIASNAAAATGSTSPTKPLKKRAITNDSHLSASLLLGQAGTVAAMNLEQEMLNNSLTASNSIDVNLADWQGQRVLALMTKENTSSHYFNNNNNTNHFYLYYPAQIENVNGTLITCQLENSNQDNSRRGKKTS